MSMNIRNAVARIPRSTAIRHSTQVHIPLGRRGVGGTSTPKHDNKGPNLPLIAGGAVIAVAAVTYAVGRSSWKHGENIAAEAKEIPQASKIGHPGQPSSSAHAEFGRDDVQESLQRSMSADAPKSAYKAEEEDAPKGVAGEISPQELNASMKQSLHDLPLNHVPDPTPQKSDAPKTAYKAEEEGNAAKGGKSSKGKGGAATN